MAHLSLHLLGGFQLAVDGAPIELQSRKAKALLAMVALDAGRSCSRAKLAAALWELSGEEQARTSLRQTLAVIRKALPGNADDWLHTEADTLSLDSEAVSVDVVAFERLAGGEDVPALERAADIYRGDLLDGLSLREEAFEEWLRAERTRLRERALGVMSQLVAHHSDAGSYETGIDIAGRLLALDPLREDVHRALMELYGRTGRADSAMRQFQTCRDVLDRELGVQPANETQQLYDTILARRSAPAERDASAADNGARAAADEPGRTLTLPDKPSVAVLPFDNMSGDPEQEYFSDSITEDIITELSRNSSLFVISRQSSFAYRNSDAHVDRIARELGVRYVLEGSVRRLGNRVRITAQLIEAANGDHVWAERYDRELLDIFDLQEDVARIIVATVAGRLDAAAETSTRAKPVRNLGAYDFVLRAQHRMQRYSKEDYAAARDLLEKAIEHDPDFARANGLLALVLAYEWFWDYADPRPHRAMVRGQKALELDDHEARTHIALCVAYVFHWDLDQAQYHIDRAIDLNPNDDLALVEKGRLLMYLGQTDSGAQCVREAMRLNPYHPNWYWNILGRNYHSAGDFEEAIATFKRISTPTFWVHAYLAACNARLDRMEDAKRHRAETISLQPDFNLTDFAAILPYSDHHTRVDFLDSFRKAGFPE